MSKFNLIPIINEFDIVETSTKLLANNRTIVLGMYAGVGKSTLIKNAFKENMSEILFITPSNRLAYEYVDEKFKANTAHKLLRIGLESDFLKEMEEVNMNGIKAICFDEIMCYNLKIRQLIEYYIKKNPQYHYYATADAKQLKAPKISEKEYLYLSDKLKVQFPNVIMLKVIKRIENDLDKQLLCDLYNMIFDYSFEWNEERKRTVLSCFESIEFDNITCDRTICYKHSTEAQVNAKIVKARGGIKIGDIIICKEKYENKKLKRVCQRNYEYNVLNVDTVNGLLIIENKLERRNIEYDLLLCTDEKEKKVFKEKLENVSFSITRFIFSKFFKLNYALCCHASQGLSINGEGVICDVLFEHSTREWLYVAISRFRKLKNNIKICWDNQPLFVKNFDVKIKSHKEEDLNKKRIFTPSEYVNIHWFMNQLQKQMYRCYNDACSCMLELDYEDGSHNAYSIDRLDSSKPHSKSNCCILCVQCNRTKKEHDNKLD